MRRNGFELKMQDRYSHFLAADSEAEMEDWVATLKQALQSGTDAVPDKRNGSEALDFATGQLFLSNIWLKLVVWLKSPCLNFSQSENYTSLVLADLWSKAKKMYATCLSLASILWTKSKSHKILMRFWEGLRCSLSSSAPRLPKQIDAILN